MVGTDSCPGKACQEGKQAKASQLLRALAGASRRDIGTGMHGLRQDLTTGETLGTQEGDRMNEYRKRVLGPGELRGPEVEGMTLATLPRASRTQSRHSSPRYRWGGGCRGLGRGSERVSSPISLVKGKEGHQGTEEVKDVRRTSWKQSF